jgi:hypothetical protein
MKRDFALTIDSLLFGIMASLENVITRMKNNIERGNISEEEFKTYLSYLAKSMTETIKLSNELHAKFPDIIPDEVKGTPRPPKP